MAQPKIIDLAEYRRAREPVPAAAPVPVCWVPVWVMVPVWQPR
jgi:hypothetical protein